jgi:hypothetical protein
MHVEQNHESPHGTNTKNEQVATLYKLQQSSTILGAAAVAGGSSIVLI